MRLALWFGVAFFLIGGGLLNAVAHDAEGVLSLAIVIGIAGAIAGAQLEHQHYLKTDNPGLKVYTLSKITAFYLIRDILLKHRIGISGWQFSRLDPESGHLIATIAFEEQMTALPAGSVPGIGSVPDQHRQITLHVQLLTPTPGQTTLQLNWQVHSPIHRDRADSIIHALSAEIDSALSTQHYAPAV